MALTGEFEKRLGLGQEGTWGVVGTVRVWVPFQSQSFGLPEQPMVAVPQTWGRREVARTVQKAKMPAPEFSFVIEPENGIGEVLKAAFGTSTVAQFGTFIAYRHTFQVQQVSELPSLFGRVLEYGTFVYDYTGLRVNTLELDFSENEYVTAKVSLLGQDRITGTAMGGTYGTTVPFTQFGNAIVQIDGTTATDIKNLKLKISNGQKQHIMVGTTKRPSFISAGDFVVTGEFTQMIQNENEITKYINGTASRLDILLRGGTFTGGTMQHELEFAMPTVEYVAFPIKQGDRVIAAQIGFMARFGTNALGTGALVGYLTNNVASYA